MHISATAFGGGVAEILYTLVPLMKDVGLDVEWQVIYGREEFFNATKLMHNALQGAPEDLTDEQWDTWRRYNEMNARELSGGWDVVLVHDPQPAALHALVPEKARGLGLALPHRPVDAQPGDDRAAAALHPRLPAVAVPHASSTCRRDATATCNVVPPAIDPLAPKNMALSPEDAAYVCEQFGIDVDRPLMCQVSRFDPVEGPARRDRRVPDGQGGGARGAARARRLDGHRRPRGLGLLQRDDRARRRRPGHPHPQQLQQRRRDRGQRLPVAGRRGDPEVDARGLRADRHARRCGRAARSSAATSAASRCRSRTASPATSSTRVESCAARALDILEDPALGKALGRRGKEHVRKHFLTPRYLRDYLRIFGELLGVPLSRR